MNFIYLRSVFPDARFIFIHRSPVEVIDSQIRMYHSILHRRNEYERLLVERVRRLYDNPTKLAVARLLYSERSPLMFWQVCRRVVQSCDYPRLGACATDVTYAELCRAPGCVAARVLRFLGLNPGTTPDYARMIRPREMRLLPVVERHRGDIEARTRDYREMFGV